MSTLPIPENPINTGRNMLQDWLAAQPTNFFTTDRALQRSLEFYWGKEGYRQHAPRLYEFGRLAATELDAAVRQASHDLSLPRLTRFSQIGQRLEEVVFHPAHHEAGRIIYGSGMMSVYAEPGQNLLSLALFFLSSLNGEAGHNCPVACTAGLIKLLQKAGSPELQERYLPRLLDPNYDTHYNGAQFLTEIQGGSDVGANGTMAFPFDEAEGSWLLRGEKWFCSNVTAHLALVTARVAGQGDGTRGLGLFLMPRHLADGSPNRMNIRRLKEKLGTRSMASGELEFHDALAYQVGPTADGFKNVMTHVINTSRLYNAVGVCANARRAHFVGWSYAQYRTAFGQPIIHFPAVQETLAQMRSDATAMTAGTWHIAHILDQIELEQADEATAQFWRMAVNLNKYRTAVLGHGVILQAIELLGGNGTIEDFSVLPRLLRDNVVYENWEGTHNVLLAQVQRDMRRYELHRPFIAHLRGLLDKLAVPEFQAEAQASLTQIEAEIDLVLAMDALTAAIYFRPLMDRLTDLFYAACLAVEGDWELVKKEDKSKRRLAVFYFNRRVAGRAARDIYYYDDQVSRLSSEL
jgi:acyl-CoA dehydrogenase